MGRGWPAATQDHQCPLPAPSGHQTPLSRSLVAPAKRAQGKFVFPKQCNKVADCLGPALALGIARVIRALGLPLRTRITSIALRCWKTKTYLWRLGAANIVLIVVVCVLVVVCCPVHALRSPAANPARQFACRLHACKLQQQSLHWCRWPDVLGIVRCRTLPWEGWAHLGLMLPCRRCWKLGWHALAQPCMLPALQAQGTQRCCRPCLCKGS